MTPFLVLGLLLAGPTLTTETRRHGEFSAGRPFGGDGNHPEPGAQEPRLEKIWDTEYDKHAAKLVREVEELEKGWKADPAAALPKAEALLAALEKDLLPRYPKHVETVILVRYSTGLKGEEKERHSFFPYRLAGEIALEAKKPERAVELLQKSPDSAALLARARKAAEEAKKPPPPVLRKPEGPDLAPFLAKADFAGAIKALAPLGKEGEPAAAAVREAAAEHQRRAVGLVAGALPRVLEEDFRAKHLDPCLAACAGVPPELESRELAWVRRLGDWTRGREADGLDRLALEAAGFDAAFLAALRVAQERRLEQMEAAVQQMGSVAGRDRGPLEERLAAGRKAFETLRARREYADLLDDLAQLEKRKPALEPAIEEARRGAPGVDAILALSARLERAWDAESRPRLSGPDQEELSLQAGIHRCLALFLQGRTVAEAAQDERVRTFFKTALPLPPATPAKVAAVRARLK